MRVEHPSIEEWSEYLDSGLEGEALRRLESHIAAGPGGAPGCEECRLLVEDLRAIAQAASELPAAIDPPERVWESISASLRERSSAAGAPASKASLPSPAFWALAAAALVMGVSSWLFLRGPDRAPADPQALANMVTEELRAAESHYEKAIQGLEQIMAQNQGVLSPELAAVLNQNLDLIQSAIDESRTAMRTEPQSTMAQESLLQALRRKVTLLQNTILLINEVRKGQGENALDRIDEMRTPGDPGNPI